ncbi:MAG: hypothetical protein GXY86_00555 [Firmicutes bacterium]|nr:hypothetical protein [Bacillota bacterium]
MSSEKIGFDLLNWQPDYTKSKEENEEKFRERYYEVYGEYPPNKEPSQ